MTRSVKASRRRHTKDNDVVAACATITWRQTSAWRRDGKAATRGGGKTGGGEEGTIEGGRKSLREHENRGRERERKRDGTANAAFGEGRGASDSRDSENARAKGYEMKFSSHPFCVSEGIPVRQEVPSRNRRKREETAKRKSAEGRRR